MLTRASQPSWTNWLKKFLIIRVLLLMIRKLRILLRLIEEFVIKTITTLPRDLKAFYRLQRLRLYLYMCQLNNDNLGILFDDTVKDHPDKVCFYFKKSTWTFRQVQLRSNQVGNYFKSKGFVKGDCIAVFMPNSPEFVFIWLGLARIGVITSWINFNLRHQSLVHCILTGDSKAVIFDTQFQPAISEIEGDEALPQGISWFSFGDPSSCSSQSQPNSETLFPETNIYEGILRAPENPPVLSEKINFNDVLCYIFTSGTTGLPKAAVMTHSRAISMTCGVYYMLTLSPRDVLYTPLPLYHVQGGIIGVGQALLCGLSQVIIPKFSATNYWSDCIQYRVSVSQYLGELCRYLLRQPRSPEEKLHLVVKMFGNGMKPELWKPFVKRFNVPCIMEAYGATEGNCQMANFEGVVGACGSSPYGIIGLLCKPPTGLYKIDKETSELIRDKRTGLAIPCGKNEAGEMLGKISESPIRAFLGYTDSNATALKIECNIQEKGDRYFRSGDLLTLDDLNYYYYVDRLGSSYRWKGETVSSEEVASVISGSIGLKEVVVFGVFIPHADGKAGMVVIANPEGPPASELAMHITTSVNKLLAPYARPLFVRFVDSINKTGTFKLQKSVLEREAFNIRVVKKETLFCLLKGKYVQLTEELYQDILGGKIRF